MNQVPIYQGSKLTVVSKAHSVLGRDESGKYYSKQDMFLSLNQSFLPFSLKVMEWPREISLLFWTHAI